ncbi:phage tail protein [Liquorilactobacillus satsumensis]|uniref:phage tail protein n=2 Tax=Liquorilactobacillus satsumensis TaxID=259059 RepID=UPI0039EAABA1
MELEEMEMLFKVNTQQMEEQFAKIQPMIDRFMGKTADSAKTGMSKTEQSMDVSKGITKVQEQLSKLNENFGSMFEKIRNTASTGATKVSQTTGNMFSGSRTKVKQDLDAMLSDINAKMDQARAAQAKARDLVNQKNSLGTAQQSGTEGVKVDGQIASAQAQMTRYQNQAKALAQAMQREFNAVPDSLKRIAQTMDQNEVKIETLRRQLTALQSSYKDVQESLSVMGDNSRLVRQSTSLEKSIMSVRDKMNRLINSNDDLNKSYAYVSDRGEKLKSIVGQLNTELGTSGSKANNSSGMFNRLGNSMREAANRMMNFGNNSSSSMEKSSSSARRCRSAIGEISQQLKFLPAQLIVFGLMYQGIMSLASGLGSALKANTQFSNSLNQIKVNLLTAFYPIYNYILPAVNALMSALAKATSWIAQFSSALFGMNYSTARSGASGLYDQVKAMNDTSSASKSAAASVKKANEEIKKQNEAQSKAVRDANRQITAANKEGAAQVQAANEQIKASNKQAQESYEETKKKNQELAESLMGFDELNLLDKSYGNDSLTKPESQPYEKFDAQDKQQTPDSQPLESTDDADGSGDGVNFNVPLGNQFNSASDAAKDLKKILGELFDPMKEAWDAKGKEVVDAAKYAWNEVKRALEDVGKSFMHVWDNGTGEKTVANILQLLADMLNIVGDIAKAFSQAWEGGGGRGTKLIQTIFDSLNSVLKLLHDIAASFRAAFNDNNLGERIMANILEIVTNIFKTIGNLASQFDKAWNKGNVGTSIFKTLLGIVNDCLSVINDMTGATAKWAAKLNFTPLLNSIDTLLKAIRPVVKDVWDGLDWGYQNLLLPLAKYTITQLIPAFFNAFAAALKVVHSIVQAAKPIFQWLWDNFLQQIAKWTGGIIVGALNTLANALEGIAKFATNHKTIMEWLIGTLIAMMTIKYTSKAYAGLITDLGKIIVATQNAKGVSGIIKSMFSKITGLDDLKKALEYTKSLGNIPGLGKVATGLTSIWTGLKNWSVWSKLAAAGQAVLSAAMVAAPYVLIAGAIAAVIVGFVELYKHNQKFREFCQNIWNSVTKWFGAVLDFAKKNWAGLAMLIVNPVAGGLKLLYDNNSGFKKWTDDLWTSVKGGLDNFGKGWTKFWSSTMDWIKKNWVGVGLLIVNPIDGAIKLLYDNNPKFKKWVDDLWSGMQKNLSNFKKGWDSYWDKLHEGADKTWDNTKKGWNDFWQGLTTDQTKNKNKKSFTQGWEQFWYDLGINMNKWWKDVQGGWSDFWNQLNIEQGKNKNKKAFSQNWNSFWSGIGKDLQSTWNDAKQSTNSAWNYVASKVMEGANNARNGSAAAWDNIKSKTSSIWSDVWNNTSSTWSNVRDRISTLASNAKENTSNIWNALRQNTSDSWANVSSAAGNIWNDIRNKVSSAASNAKDNTLSAWDNLRNNTPGYFENIKSTIGNAFNSVVSSAGSLGGRVANGIRNGMSTIRSAIGDMANSIKNPIKNAIDKIKDGINWVLSKVGQSGFDFGWFNWATGTSSHPGGLAMVNDQAGPSYRESFELPNGKQGIFPDVRNLLLPLPQGTKVKTSAETAKQVAAMAPHYAGGIGDFNFDFSGLDHLMDGFDFSSLLSGIGDFTSGIVDEFDNILDDITHPRKMLDYMINKFVKISEPSELQQKLTKGAVNKTEDGLVGWASKILKQFGGSTKQNGAGAEGWRSAVKKGLRENGLPTTDSYVNAWIRQIQTESGGNERAVQGGYTDINTLTGDLAKGLLQTISATFNAYKFPGHDDIFKGYDNILAAINYAKHRYGSDMLGVIGHGHGYENGGMVSLDGMYHVAEGNKPEMILPLTNTPRALELIKQALAFMGQTFSGGLQMPAALTQQMDLGSLGVTSSSGSQNINGGGINELGSSIVNALLQGLQMTNISNSSASSQPINVNLTLQVGDEKFGSAAIKGINAVNQKNGKNMLKL